MVLELTPAEAIELAHAILEKARMVNEKASDVPGAYAYHYVTANYGADPLRIRIGRDGH